MENVNPRLIARAIEQRWPIPVDVKQAAIKVLTKIMLDKTASNRDRNRAIEALMKLEAQNQTDEHTTALQSDRNRFLEVAQQLGIDANFRRVGQDAADAGDGGVDGGDGIDDDGDERP
jgi:hypothetical protein